MWYAAGKVVAPLICARPGDKKIDKTTGEVHEPRADRTRRCTRKGPASSCGPPSSASLQRHPGPHSRFVIDVAHVPTPGTEAATAVDHFTQLAPVLPGAQRVIYDTALRGTHHQRLMQELGWLSVNRVSANGSAPVGEPEAGQRQEAQAHRDTWMETKTVKTPADEVEVRLIAEGGRIGWETTEMGEPVFVPLERVRTHRNGDKRGNHRWYDDDRLPERLGGWDCQRPRAHERRGSSAPVHQGRERPADPTWRPRSRTLYQRRDAESVNRHLDDTLWLRRAHSVGSRRQSLHLITYVIGVNAMSMHVHHQDPAPPLAA